MAELAAEFPNLVCVLAGGVVRGTESFKAGLDAFVRDAGLGARVRFLGHRTDVPDIVAAFDVAVHASITPEPFGRVLIEAMGLGKPLVASDAGGVPEIVIEGESGCLVPPGDHMAMARALRPLLRSAELRAAMGERGRRRVREHFSVERFAREMEAVYREVLGG
jgi:glycosyltransferase involved in cell wall biosynthesis